MTKRQLKKAEAYHFIFKLPEGKIVLTDMLKAHSFLQSTYVENDPVAMAMREGERNAVLRILAILKTTPVQLRKLIEEADSDE